MDQAACEAAATANCVNGADADPDPNGSGKTMWIEDGPVGSPEYLSLQNLVDQGTMDFWGVNGLPKGCYVLKGTGGTAYYFFKTVEGSVTSPTTGDKNICAADGKILNQKLYKALKRCIGTN